MHWRDRFLYCMEARQQGAAPRPARSRATTSTSRPATMEDMYERAEFAKELGSRHRHGRPRHRLDGDPVDGEMGAQERHDPAHAPRRPLTYTRQKNHGVSFRVIAKWLRLAGVDHLHAGTVVGKLEGDPRLGAGLLRRAARDVTTRQNLRARPVLRPGLGRPAQGHAGRLGRHPRRADAPAARPVRRRRGAAVRRRHDRPSRGHPGRRHRQPRRARGDGQGAQRGPRHPAARARRSSPTPPQWCTPLRAALDTWGDVTFNYASTDTLDCRPDRRRRSRPEQTDRCASHREHSRSCPT